MSYTLDKAIAMAPLQNNRYTLPAAENYFNFTSAFGGWVAAVAVAALEQEDRAEESLRGEIITVNLHFMAAVEAGEVLVSVELTERRKTIDFWRVVLSKAERPDMVLASIDIIAGIRRASEIRHSAYADDPVLKAAPQDGIKQEANAMTPRWFGYYEQYNMEGTPFIKSADPVSSSYARESDGRPMDAKSLVALMDSPMPRSFYFDDKPRLASTLMLSTHVYANAGEIAEVGDDFVLLKCDCAAVHSSLFNQEVYMVRRDGLVLATSYQTAIFR